MLTFMGWRETVLLLWIDERLLQVRMIVRGILIYDDQ